MNNLDLLKIEYIWILSTWLSEKGIDRLPKELFRKKNKIVLNSEKMRDTFSKDLLQAITDIKEFINSGG